MDALTLAQQIVTVARQSGLRYSRIDNALEIARSLLTDGRDATRDDDFANDDTPSAIASPATPQRLTQKQLDELRVASTERSAAPRSRAGREAC